MGTHLFLLCRVVLVLLCCLSGTPAGAQEDTAVAKKTHNVSSPVDPNTVSPFLSDSAIQANHRKYLADSIAMSFLMPDSTRSNQLWEKVLKTDPYAVFEQPMATAGRGAALSNGKLRGSRPHWILAVILGLLLYTGLLNIFLGADVRAVLSSFYNKNALTATEKESGLINSWAFIGLFALFCFAAGLVLFLVVQYYGWQYRLQGFQLFLVLSIGTGILLAVKFLILKFIGYIFETGAVVSEYIAVLNLTYFNVAFVLLVAAACLSLASNVIIPTLLTFTLVLTGIIFAWQYIRNSLSIISEFRFQKFYLFIYLCALEICPVLILIKALIV
jgi:MFS family permease